MFEESTILKPIGNQTPSEASQEDNAGALVVSRDFLPDDILILPLYVRPMFPKMMGPIAIDNPQIQKIIFEAKEQSRLMYLGLLLVRPTEDTPQHVPENISDFFQVGVAARIINIANPTEMHPCRSLSRPLNASMSRS